MANSNIPVVRVLGENATKEEKSSYWNTLIAIALLHLPHFDFPHEFMQNVNFTAYTLVNEDIPEIMKEVMYLIAIMS